MKESKRMDKFIYAMILTMGIIPIVIISIRSILMMILGDILYVYFLVYILKEFKRISQ